MTVTFMPARVVPSPPASPISRMVYRYRWGNNAKRAQMKGRECVIRCAGAKRSTLVEFLDDGQLEVVSVRALERLGWRTVPSHLTFWR